MHSKISARNKSHLVLMANVRDAQFKCLMCKKIFISEIYLKRHEVRRHSIKDVCKSTLSKEEISNVNNGSGSSVKDTNNVVERFEDLIVKLSLNETSKPSLSPIASSSKCNFDTTVNTYKNIILDENKQLRTYYNLDGYTENVPELKYPVNYEEKKIITLQDIASSVLYTGLQSNHCLNPVITIESLQQDLDRIDVISSSDDSCDRSVDSPSRFKSELVNRLNNKLESYGVNSEQNTLSDEEMLKIVQLIKNERSQVAKVTPEYCKLIDVINCNIQKRTEHLKTKVC